MDRSNLSFIPKKDLTSLASKEKGASFVLTLSILVLLVSLLFYGGVFLYQQTVKADIAAKQGVLDKIKSQLEPQTVREISRLATRIEALKIILARHRSLQDFFGFIGEYTLKTVRFGSFKYTDSDESPVVELQGTARSFGSISLQGEKFYENANIKGVLFSGFTLKENGFVGFSAKIIADPQLFAYKPNVENK